MNNQEFVITDSVLIKYTGHAQELVIPDGVTEIGSLAFENCTDLIKVTLPHGLTVIGEWAFGGCTHLQEVTLPDTLTVIGDSAFSNCTGLRQITLPHGLQKIGDSAFSRCSALRNIALPDSLTEIGPYAFKCCNALRAVAIPPGITILQRNMFEHCTALKKVTLPHGLKEIGQAVFMECSGLKTIRLPESLTTLGSAVFRSSGIEEIEIPNGITKLPDYAFQSTDLKCIVLPETLTEIGAWSMHWCSDLRSLLIPPTVTKIGDHALTFTKLTKLWIPDSVKEIGDYAFAECKVLELLHCPWDADVGKDAFLNTPCEARFARRPEPKPEKKATTIEMHGMKLINRVLSEYHGTDSHVTVPEGTVEIGISVFYKCKTLHTVKLPESLKKINQDAFRCSTLQSIRIPQHVKEINDRAFLECSELTEFIVDERNSVYCSLDGVLFTKDRKKLLRYPRAKQGRFTLPYTVEEVVDEAFGGYTGLTEIVLTKGLRRIGKNAFSGCTALRTVCFPVTLKDIGECSFSGCTSLRTVTIQEGCEELPLSLFHSCTALTDVRLPESLREIGAQVFGNCSSLETLTCPDGLEKICTSAFSGCTSLRTVRLPDSVGVVTNAFADSPFGKREAARLAAMKAPPPPTAERVGLVMKNNAILHYKGNAEVLDFHKNVIAFVTKIGYRAFYRCESLRVIVLPATCHWIETQAFFGCPNLERVEIGDKRVVFGDEAFALCGKLDKVIMERDPWETGAHNVFAGTPFERKRRETQALGDNSGT